MSNMRHVCSYIPLDSGHSGCLTSLSKLADCIDILAVLAVVNGVDDVVVREGLQMLVDAQLQLQKVGPICCPVLLQGSLDCQHLASLLVKGFEDPWQVMNANQLHLTIQTNKSMPESTVFQGLGQMPESFSTSRKPLKFVCYQLDCAQRKLLVALE